MSRYSFSTAEQGDSAHMPEDENRKKRSASTGRHAESSAEDSLQPDLAFDPIAAALRQLHESVASEAIPDDFLLLLDQLDDRAPPE